MARGALSGAAAALFVTVVGLPLAVAGLPLASRLYFRDPGWPADLGVARCRTLRPEPFGATCPEDSAPKAAMRSARLPGDGLFLGPSTARPSTPVAVA